MRNVNLQVLSGQENQNVNGSQIDANQMVAASFHAYFGDSQGTGTFKLQASNDIPKSPNMVAMDGFAVTNWVDIPSQSASVTSGTSALLTIANSAYRWLRAVWTATGTGTQTIVPIADTGAKQSQQITTVADSSGSLNSKYFTISSVNLVTKARKDFYVWFDNGSGVDPAVPGKTGIHVTYSNNATAATLAAAIGTACNALTNDYASSSGSGANIVINGKACGAIPAAADGTAATGFTFATPSTVGANSNLNNTYFYVQDEASAHSYYVWFNVDSLGTDPTIAGRTGSAITLTSGSSAGTVGAALASAIGGLNSSLSFTATGTTTVTVTNKQTGPFVPMTDAGATGFAFAVTAGGNSTVTVTMNGLSV